MWVNTFTTISYIILSFKWLSELLNWNLSCMKGGGLRFLFCQRFLQTTLLKTHRAMIWVEHKNWHILKDFEDFLKTFEALQTHPALRMIYTQD